MGCECKEGIWGHDKPGRHFRESPMTRSVIFKWFTTVQHEEQRAGATVEPGVINVGCYCCAMSVSEKIALGKDGKKLK